MEDAPEIEMNQNTIVDNDFVDRSFEHGLKNVKRTVQHMFLKENWINWKVSYFSKMVKHTLIMKKGTESDKLRSEASKSKCNNERKMK